MDNSVYSVSNWNTSSILNEWIKDGDKSITVRKYLLDHYGGGVGMTDTPDCLALLFLSAHVEYTPWIKIPCSKPWTSKVIFCERKQHIARNYWRVEEEILKPEMSKGRQKTIHDGNYIVF